MKEIPLTRGFCAIVDDADYDWLNTWNWHTKKGCHTYYAVRSDNRKSNSKRVKISMHRLILGLRPGDKSQCDHIDNNGLNNQQTNLRVCTIAENQHSSRKYNICTSTHKGASWNPRVRKWYSYICVNKKRIHLGCYDSEIMAATAYNKAALKHFGDFAQLNTL